MTALTERRATDRRLMAAEVERIAAIAGFKTKRGGFPGPREIRVEIETRHGLHAAVEFDGDSPQVDVFVVPWYTQGKTRLDPSFGIPGCPVNPHHFGKCTAVARGFDDLCDHLRIQFEKITTGSAFQAGQFGPDNVEAAAQEGSNPA